MNSEKPQGVIRYVAGFLFSEDKKDLVLIRKTRPEWMYGKFNAIGGKVEPGEVPIDAMVREFEEETGLLVSSWEVFCLLTDNKTHSVSFFRARASIENAFPERQLMNAKSGNGEMLYRLPVATWLDPQLSGLLLPNVPWLIQMALMWNEKPYLVTELSEELQSYLEGMGDV